MKIIITEDEENVASRLCNLIESLIPDVEIVEVIDSVEEVVKWLTVNKHPDLAFMDIQLSDGLSFSIFEKVVVECPIIFTTAFNEYAMKAFEVNSIDYLLKPIYEDKLLKSFEKYESLKKQWANKDFQQQLTNAIQAINKNQGNYKSRILIQKNDSLVIVPVNDAAWFMAEDKEVILVTTKNERHIVGQSLEKIEKQLDPGLFYRVNRQFIISIGSIEKISNYFNYKLKIHLSPKPEHDIIIGRKK